MSHQPIRIWRVPKQVFGPRELETAAAAMTPEILGRIAERGFTGVWTLVRLRDVVRTDVLPELGAAAASQQAVLAEYSARCRAAGLKLYLYFNEPRAFADDDPIWEVYPPLARNGLRGAVSLPARPRRHRLHHCQRAPDALLLPLRRHRVRPWRALWPAPRRCFELSALP